MHSSDGSTWTKLLDIISFSGMQRTKGTIDTTTMSDKSPTSIPGMYEANSGLSAVANYDPVDYQAVVALRDKKEHYAIWLGGTDVEGSQATPTGDLGKFSWEGIADVTLNDMQAGNNARQMTVNISFSTEIVEDFSASV